jgi:hypothetical protein
MIANVPNQKQERVFWLLLGLGFAAVLVGTLAHLSFVSGLGSGLLLVAIASRPLMRLLSGKRG